MAANGINSPLADLHLVHVRIARTMEQVRIVKAAVLGSSFLNMFFGLFFGAKGKPEKQCFISNRVLCP